MENNSSRRKINKLLVVFRKVTLLAVSAISTTIIINLGYTYFKVCLIYAFK